MFKESQIKLVIDANCFLDILLCNERSSLYENLVEWFRNCLDGIYDGKKFTIVLIFTTRSMSDLRSGFFKRIKKDKIKNPFKEIDKITSKHFVTKQIDKSQCFFIKFLKVKHSHSMESIKTCDNRDKWFIDLINHAKGDKDKYILTTRDQTLYDNSITLLNSNQCDRIMIMKNIYELNRVIRCENTN